MVIQWQDFRTMIRVGALQDNPDDPVKRRWTDDQLRIYVGWALNTLCAHTAMATATVIPDVSGTRIDLPGNVYADLERTGIVGLVSASGTVTYLNPTFFTSGLDPYAVGNQSFYTENNRTLILTTAPVGANSLSLRYFAYYNVPFADTDTIDCPEWALTAVMWQTAAHAMTGYSNRAAQIRQWAEKPEQGTPEHNPFRQQQKWFTDLYEEEIRRHTPQVRANPYRSK